MGAIVAFFGVIFLIDLWRGKVHRDTEKKYNELVDKYNKLNTNYTNLYNRWKTDSQELSARRAQDGVQNGGGNTYYRDERQVNMHNEVHNVRNETNVPPHWRSGTQLIGG